MICYDPEQNSQNNGQEQAKSMENIPRYGSTSDIVEVSRESELDFKIYHLKESNKPCKPTISSILC